MCLASCVPFLTSKKEDGGEVKKVDHGPALIKPKIRDNPGDAGAKSSKAASQLSAKPDKSGKAATPEKFEEFDDKPATAVTKAPEKPVDRIAAGKGKESDTEPSLAGKTKDALEVPSPEDLSKSGASFKKHDHAKYADKIKNSAKELVHQEPTCKFARLCRDATTDQWDLNLYYVQEKTYVLAAYAWDEIDGNWKEAFKSDKLPISRWKGHLEFSSSRKKCSILKGSPP